FGARCAQATRGALWNFRQSGPPHWHRDGLLPLFNAVTVAHEYPESAGFPKFQPYTQEGAIDEDSQPGKEPQVHKGEEPGAAVPLRPGELLLFLYSTKHAAVPNFSQQDRCLLYSVYGPAEVCDTVNIKKGRPSLESYTQAEADILKMMADGLR
ncbi:unnamed protein product, partial [Effrenium voratum]